MSNKYIKLENLAYYNGKIKEYINNNIGTGNGVAIYEDYSKLPTDLTEDTIAYCKNDYVDNTDVDNPITYKKSLYYYNEDNAVWSIISFEIDLSDIQNSLDNKVDKDGFKGLSTNDFSNYYMDILDNFNPDISNEYMTKEIYASEENEDSVKKADKIYNVEAAQPLMYYGKNINGEIGFHFLPINDGTLPAGEMEQRTINPVVAGQVYVIDSVNKLTESKLYIQCFKELKGLQDVFLIANTYDTSNADNYYYDPDNTSIDSNIRIKTDFPCEINVNSNDMYETDIINKNDFIKLQLR